MTNTICGHPCNLRITFIRLDLLTLMTFDYQGLSLLREINIPTKYEVHVAVRSLF